jgi:hypothetical protein
LDPKASAPFADTPSTAVRLDINSRTYYDNTGDTASNEPFGATDGYGCEPAGLPGVALHFDHTLWLRFTANSDTAVVHTGGSDIDMNTALAAYPADSVGTTFVTSTLLNCDVGFNASLAASLGGTVAAATIIFPTTPGKDYLVQAGGLSNDATGPSSASSLPVTLITSDRRAFAMPVALNSSATLSNELTGTEIGEPLVCQSTTYGATLWLKFHTDLPGSVEFGSSVSETSGGLPVVAIFRANELSPLGCGTTSGQSTLRAQTTAAVTPGDYYAQVATTDGYGGVFTYTLRFTENADADGDGVPHPPSGADCNDADPNIKPTAVDITNGIDDNCDGIVDPDKDSDGYLAAPLGQDCNDAVAGIHPGALELKGNRIDENCDGIKDRFDVVNSSYTQTPRVRGGRTTFSELLIRSVPAGALVRMTCSGGRTHGCPGTYSKRFRKAQRSVSLLRQVRGHQFRPGAFVRVSVTASNLWGKSWVFRFTKKGPKVTRGVVGDGYAAA